MSARNPTNFNEWNDESELIMGKPVLVTAPSAVMDDQTFVLDIQELVISDSFTPVRMDNATTPTVFVTQMQLYCMSKDMCNEVGVTNNEIAHDLYFRAFCSDGTTAGSIKFISTAIASATAGPTAVAAGTTAATWFGPVTFNVKTNGILDTLSIQGKRTAGAGHVYLCGWGLFANET